MWPDFPEPDRQVSPGPRGVLPLVVVAMATVTSLGSPWDGGAPGGH